MKFQTELLKPFDWPKPQAGLMNSQNRLVKLLDWLKPQARLMRYLIGQIHQLDC